MNQKALQILEYHKIIDKLVDKASSAPGKELCRNLLPEIDLTLIEENQEHTKDALNRLFKKGGISFGGNKPVGRSLSSLEIGSCLSSAELLMIAGLLENANRIKTYGRKERDDAPADSLDEFFNAIEPLTFVSEEIRRCILAEDEFADDASPNLKHIRRSKLLINEKIHSQLNSMVNGSLRTYLQDAVITMRNNRYCIPVKAEYKGQVSGMIHDQSSTGSTLFIEPMAIVKLNNDLKELVSVSGDESINYKMEQLGMRAYGSIMINGEYKNASLKKEFKDSIDIDILAQYEKIEDRNDFTVKIEDFDYYINDGNLSLVIEAYIYGVKDDDDRIIETHLYEEIQDVSEEVEELMRLDEQILDIEKSATPLMTSDAVNVPIVKKVMDETMDEESDEEDLGTYYLYVVDDGDTYRSISSHYKVDENAVRQYNHERPLDKGTIVIIPYS